MVRLIASKRDWLQKNTSKSQALFTLKYLLLLPDWIHMHDYFTFCSKQWKIYHMGVKPAFLNGTLEKEVYIEQPASYVIPREEDKVYILKKALYGLK